MLARGLREVVCAGLLTAAAVNAAAEDVGPVRALERNGSVIAWPRWSPDGSQIGFWANTSDGPRIFTADPDGSRMTPVTDRTEVVGLPGWSPDGSAIAYMVWSADGQRLHTQELASGARGSLAALPNVSGSPAWSPDGKVIAIASAEAKYPGIFLIALDGTGLRRLPSPSGRLWSPTWSPDGSSVLVCAQDDDDAHMWRIAADGFEVEGMVRLEGNRGLNTSWSPDHEWIVYVRPSPDSQPGMGASSLYAVSVDGRRSIRVTGNGESIDDYPSWSPSGREIVFVRRQGTWRATRWPPFTAIDVSAVFPDVVEAAERQAQH